MTAVHVARAQGVAGFERLVAIKVLHPHLAYEDEFIPMFLDEARLAALIRHPNVVPTLDISDSQGDGYFGVMDYIEGDHLGTVLGASAKRGERLEQGFVCRAILDTLQGLSAAHQLVDESGRWLQLVHRDVSPHNILVGIDGICHLTDFGVAKAEVRMASTRAGQFKGKLSYMAPEQASSGHTDQRSDLFSMGVILWESLTGRRLFKGETNAATLTKILNEEVPAPSELWTDLERYDAVVIKALARDPDDRFQSADEFAAALEQTIGREALATPRDVGATVRTLCEEKLKNETQRVADAIQSLGRTEIERANMPRPSQAAKARLSDGFARPDPISSNPPIVVHSGRESRALKLLVLILMLLVAAGFTLLYKSWQQPPMRNAPMVQPAATSPTPTPTSAKPPELKQDGDGDGSEEVEAAKIVKPLRKRKHVRRPATKPTSSTKASKKPNTKPKSTLTEKTPPPEPEIELNNPYRQ